MHLRIVLCAATLIATAELGAQQSSSANEKFRIDRSRILAMLSKASIGYQKYKSIPPDSGESRANAWSLLMQELPDIALDYALNDCARLIVQRSDTILASALMKYVLDTAGWESEVLAGALAISLGDKNQILYKLAVRLPAHDKQWIAEVARAGFGLDTQADELYRADSTRIERLLRHLEARH